MERFANLDPALIRYAAKKKELEQRVKELGVSVKPTGKKGQVTVKDLEQALKDAGEYEDIEWADKRKRAQDHQHRAKIKRREKAEPFSSQVLKAKPDEAEEMMKKIISENYKNTQLLGDIRGQIWRKKRRLGDKFSKLWNAHGKSPEQVAEQEKSIKRTRRQQQKRDRDAQRGQAARIRQKREERGGLGI